MEIEIKGHSGCQVEIVNKGGNLYISKSTHKITFRVSIGKPSNNRWHQGLFISIYEYQRFTK